MTGARRKASWALGVAAAAGMIAGAVLAVPSGAQAIVGPQFRAGQVVVGAQDALGDEESLLDYPLVVATRNGDDGGIITWADGGAPTLNVISSGPAVAARFTSSSANVTSLTSYGAGPGGRGASFEGEAAQMRLVPARTTHPKSGALGDFFLDKAGKLWFCQGGTKWKQLA